MDYLNEHDFFKYLLRRTSETFQQSETKKKYPTENWNYAICDTPIQKNVGVFFGLNWGGNDIDPQSHYPEKEKPRNWKFISHSRKYFLKYYNKKIEDLNYSNLCFFRSPKAHQIAYNDWEIVLPLFKEYLDYINPPWTLMLGKPHNSLIPLIDEYCKIPVKDKNKTYYGHLGRLFGKYKWGSVPHPNARLKAEARDLIWQRVKIEGDFY